MTYTVYIFMVSYVDGNGKTKLAKVVSRNKNESDFVLLQAAMGDYYDAFAQEYKITLVGEETRKK